MKDTIFMNVVYMYIQIQRTENERLAHNQVNIPIADTPISASSINRCYLPCFGGHDSLRGWLDFYQVTL